MMMMMMMMMMMIVTIIRDGCVDVNKDVDIYIYVYIYTHQQGSDAKYDVYIIHNVHIRFCIRGLPTLRVAPRLSSLSKPHACNGLSGVGRSPVAPRRGTSLSNGDAQRF